MYALAKIAGRQYRVEPGAILKVDKLGSEPGSEVTISDVMFYAKDDKQEIGTPFLPYDVKLEVLEHGRHRKVTSMHFKRRGGRRRKVGHRQWFTKVKVQSIEAGK